MDHVELDTGAARVNDGAHAPVAPSPFGYQPALDGLRAVAILSVMLFHLVFHNRLILEHGLLGVDAFFVLSGFLITTLLLREHGRKDRISLGNFYLRRALRLLPLLACVLVFAVVVNVAFSAGYPGRPSGQGITAAAFYYANWYTLHHNTGLGFLGVTWSLSIEEQFYLCWPLLLMGLLALKPSRKTVALTIVGATLVSVVYRMSFWYRAKPQRTFVDFYMQLTGRGQIRSQPEPGVSRVYFGSDTRAHQLLLGCALAALLLWLVPRLTARAHRVMHAAGVIAAIVMVSFLCNWPRTSRAWVDHWGALIFELAVAVLIGSLVLAPRAPLTRAMSWRPMTWTGQRAYGLYLIHPIVYQYLGEFGLGDWVSIALRVGVVFAGAWFAYRFIEAPALRLKDRMSTGPLIARA
ncbi:MAG: hypothetical protein JWL83_2003 [Actinomycetia bacterium]|nr:hypothetical protein [Actinomycetes bacterium]